MKFEYIFIISTGIMLMPSEVSLKKDSFETPMSPRHLHLTVSTILVEPYTMLSNAYPNATEPRYEGYIVDLVDEIMKLIGIGYRLEPVMDGSYGYKDDDGSWDGMVGELVNKNADMAAGPLYITRPRSTVVEFSEPFMTVRATLLQLRQSPAHKTVDTVRQLLDQDDIRYGMIKSGMLVRAFRTANDSFYRSLWSRMRNFSPTVYTDTNEIGIQRVRDSGGKYAFILPDSIGDYIVRQSPCDLIVTDKFLMKRAFGLAVQKGSGLLPQINRALDILKSNGILQQLFEKWWVKRSACNGIHSSKIISLNGCSCLTNCPLLMLSVLFIVHCLSLLLDKTG